MQVRAATDQDISAIAALRRALWPSPEIDHPAEIERLLHCPGGDMTVFVARAASGAVIGFAEASIRRDYVNGCSTSPVAFLEGIFVDPASRRTGAARALVAAVETWGAVRGCVELASDADLANTASHAMHQALGFEETERVVCFRKDLGPLRAATVASGSSATRNSPPGSPAGLPGPRRSGG